MVHPAKAPTIRQQVYDLLQTNQPNSLWKTLDYQLILKILSSLKPSDISAFGNSCKGFYLATQDEILSQVLLHRIFQTRCLPKQGPFFRAYKNLNRIYDNLANEVYSQTFLRGHDVGPTATLLARGHLFSASGDTTIKRWDLATRECTSTLVGHQNAVLSLAYNHDMLFSGCQDGTIHCWNLEAPNAYKVIQGHDAPVLCLAAGNGLLMTGAQNGEINLFNSCTGDYLRTLDKSPEKLSTFTYDQGRLIAGYGNGTIKIWDLNTDFPPLILKQHSGRISSLICVGDVFYSSSYDRTIRCWNQLTGNCIDNLQDHTFGVSGLVRAENMLLSGSYDGTIKIWDLDTHQCLRTLSPCKEWIWSLLYTDGKIITSSQDKSIRILNFNTDNSTIWKEIACAFESRNSQSQEQAMERFRRMPEEERKNIYAELSLLLSENSEEGPIHGEDAFYHQNGQFSTPKQKALAITRYLFSIHKSPDTGA